MRTESIYIFDNGHFSRINIYSRLALQTGFSSTRSSTDQLLSSSTLFWPFHWILLVLVGRELKAPAFIAPISTWHTPASTPLLRCPSNYTFPLMASGETWGVSARRLKILLSMPFMNHPIASTLHLQTSEREGQCWPFSCPPVLCAPPVLSLLYSAPI